MNAETRIIQGLTQRHYHTLPDELEQVTVNPERSAIFGYMANIGWKRFPEFISDILVRVEGHRLIDITDGPGDEKLDILSEAPDGRRHLTQTKHVAALDAKVSGDDLDILLPACLRKDCAVGLYVTNSDLTPQAKRYVNDREYARGWKGPIEQLPHIDYWTGATIWERISRNSAILNKWFSGMGQTHALRRFYFDLLVQKLPGGEIFDLPPGTLAEWLSGGQAVRDLGEGLRLEVPLDDQVRVTISRSFRSSVDLDLPYVGPKTDEELFRAPLCTFRLEAQVADTVGQFDPAHYRDRVVEAVMRLPHFNIEGQEWWHFIATAPRALVFLHDVNEPKVLSVAQAAAYARTESTNGLERRWYHTNSENVKWQGESDSSLAWEVAEPPTKIMLVATQRPDPIAAYDMHVRQYELKTALATSRMRRVRNVDDEQTDRVRQIVPPGWCVVTTGDDVIWAAPEDALEQRWRQVDEAVEKAGLTVEILDDDQRREIVESIEEYPPQPSTMGVGYEDSLCTPLWIPKRVLWLARETELANSIAEETVVRLVQFKLDFEIRYGSDLLNGKEAKQLTGAEIQRFLCDPYTLRGTRMLDVEWTANTLRLHVRFRERRMEPLDELIADYLEQFNILHHELLSAMSN